MRKIPSPCWESNPRTPKWRCNAVLISLADSQVTCLMMRLLNVWKTIADVTHSAFPKLKQFRRLCLERVSELYYNLFHCVLSQTEGFTPVVPNSMQSTINCLKCQRQSDRSSISDMSAIPMLLQANAASWRRRKNCHCNGGEYECLLLEQL
jgi:hypothetical protein